MSVCLPEVVCNVHVHVHVHVHYIIFWDILCIRVESLVHVHMRQGSSTCCYIYNVHVPCMLLHVHVRVHVYASVHCDVHVYTLVHAAG